MKAYYVQIHKTYRQGKNPESRKVKQKQTTITNLVDFPNLQGKTDKNLQI